ncbi:extracellular solute-binding protein [Metabacillus halosaccharovorans]|uniref:Extracellular solute-binding protein n=1 Tax=Metabacillus halosaccharovorans TaxID=930124 RepID=A0ABT3DJZ2_9BACI|nr:extracellular solute-binding protein [Metabacillus halosaccharovorans]MCV9887312.1 extracellular solute-binding protein [Metabacillus halosaccharovorans]
MRLFQIILGFVLLVVMIGCTNLTIIDEHSPAKIEEDQVNEKIEIWHTYSEQETKIFENEVIPLFEQEHPEIDIKPVRQAHNKQLMSSLISRASVNSTPDIIRMDITWMPKFADLKLLYPVSRFDDFNELKNRFYDAPLKSNVFEGSYYGLPLNSNTKVAIYNRQVLSDIGLKTPPRKMEEFIQIIEENNLKIGMLNVHTWGSLPYFYGLGGELTDPNHTKATGYLDSENSIKAVKKLVELYQNSNLPKQIVSGYPETWQNIRNGNYFMIDEGPWFYSVQPNDEIALINKQTISAPFPDNGESSSILGGENIVMTKGTKHREAAWTFMKWMTTDTPQKLLLQAGLLPTNRHVPFSGNLDKYPYYKSYIESIDQAHLRPQVPEWEQINDIYTNYLRQIFYEQVSVEDGLKKAAMEIDQLLALDK